MPKKILFSRTSLLIIFLTMVLIPVLHAEAGFEEKIMLEVNMSPTLIEPLKRKNIDLKTKIIAQETHISWKVKNNSDIILNKKNYVFFLTYGRVEENERTIMKKIHKTIQPGKTVKGKYRHKFHAIIGSSGDYEVQLELAEISNSPYFTPIKKVSFPFRIEVPDAL